MSTRDENIAYEKVKMNEEKQPLAKTPRSPKPQPQLDNSNIHVNNTTSATTSSSFQHFETEGNLKSIGEDEEDFATNPTQNQGYAYNPSRIPYHDRSSTHYTIFSLFLPYFLLHALFPPKHLQQSHHMAESDKTHEHHD